MHKFIVPFKNAVLKGDTIEGSGSVLLLHGAGSSNRTRAAILRSALQKHGIGSCAFDFIGHGETGGTLAESSLSSRTRQTEAVIAALDFPQPLVVFGSSMGAYNAIKLTSTMPIRALVLIVPGVFTQEAYEVPFGPQFSSIIRRERSWIDTDAWYILAQFTGKLLELIP